jgi:tetratricopeptide (TPR) repeat protein
MLRRVVPALLLLLLGTAALASAQVADPKAAFAEALGQFSLALDGAFGDEGPRILASLDALDRGLAQWDATIKRYEAGMAEEAKNADPKLAALAHMALGGVYLDRGRVDDALREFTEASVLDPGRAYAAMLQGLANCPPFPHRPPAAIAAFQKASALDPADVITSYLLGRQLAAAGKKDEAVSVWRRIGESLKPTADERRVAAAMPFMRFGVVEERSGVEPLFPPAAYADGFALLARRDYAAAISAFRTAAGRDRLVADQANRYGMKRAADAFRDGAIATAVEQLEAAIELAPERAEPHRVLGLVWAAAEQFERAIDELKTAVRLDPGDERTRLALADVPVQLPLL